MKVTATQEGFFHKLIAPGMVFDIPDTPVRKVTKADDAITQSIALKGNVPCAFASSWMRPGAEGQPIPPVAVQSHLKPAKGLPDEVIDLNADVI
jgi:hypothetical protein